MTMQNKQQSTFSKPNTNQQNKHGLHPRNKHRTRYDFRRLTQASPDLAQYVHLNHYQAESIDFSNPAAVKSLNQAILKSCYGIIEWDIPDNHLCPAIPGRADYIHHIADVLSTSNKGVIPTGSQVRIIDIGVGANCVYPIIGNSEYGWSFVGSDIDPFAVASANKIIQTNKQLDNVIEIRLQANSGNIFKGILKEGDAFDLAMCNPPFHASPTEAMHGTRRKWKNLGKISSVRNMQNDRPVLNFGGQNNELWCKGGETAFISRMIEESSRLPQRSLWFSTLVSRVSSLPVIYRKLEISGCVNMKTINMTQGQKKSRIVAWTFIPQPKHDIWYQGKS